MTATHYDLIVLGTGSGNSLVEDDMADQRVAIVEPDVFGGTCLNRGCIPSKMFVLPAEIAHRATSSAHLGIHASEVTGSWRAIRDRVFGRIDPIAASGDAYRSRLPYVDVHRHPAFFVGPKRLRVGDLEITGDQIVIAVGSRPTIPLIPGLVDVPHVTSDTFMRLDERPDDLIILGGGFIGCEMGHVVDGLGGNVTIVTRGAGLLTAADREISEAMTAAYRARGIRVITGARPVGAAGGTDRVALEIDSDEGRLTVDGDLLLLAIGRTSNSDILMLDAAGVDTGPDGQPLVDAHQQTNVAGVWALGDVSSEHWLKHVANAEARAVHHNIRHPDDLIAPVMPHVPSAVFGSPQVATVGALQRDLDAAGTPYLVGKRGYDQTAYGWALEDTTSFAKVLVDPETRLLLGAHIIGPEASILIQPLVQAMALGNTVDEVRRGVVWIHPALTEVIEQVLLEI